MADTRYDDLKISAVRDDTQGMYLVGADIGGVFIPFSAIKTGHVDELLEREQEREQQQREQQQRQQQQQQQ